MTFVVVCRSEFWPGTVVSEPLTGICSENRVFINEVFAIEGGIGVIEFVKSVFIAFYRVDVDVW